MTEPWVRFEDEHLLAVHKPAGVNSHRAAAHAQDGMYEWVQSQRPADALSLLHRLDKGTSGVLVFGKTTAANRALTAQFEGRSVGKRYELLVRRDDRRPPSLHADDPIEGASGRQAASTDFDVVASGPHYQHVVARPHSGRTHQVRVHAAALGMPVVGDADHGGEQAVRLFLHAAALQLDHPLDGPMTLTVARPASFDALLEDVRGAGTSLTLAAVAAREARDVLFDANDTDAYVWIDRHHDGVPEVRVERLGNVALVLSFSADGDDGPPPALVEALNAAAPLQAVHAQHRPRGGAGPVQHVSGTPEPHIVVREHGLQYGIDLHASATSTGLFLDQRETRRALRTADLRGRTVLNVFAHTGSLSVAAAAAGAETLSLDLSKRYLDWARENLRCNGLDPADHDFVYGDALEWMDRFAKKARAFDVVVVDPPSTSTSRGRGSQRWSVERDYDTLVARAARLCAPGGRIFASTNLRRLAWPSFLAHLERGLASAGRHGRIRTRTVPLDHRTGPGDPPHLKAAWIDLDDG